ncbi:MAG TPA: hypothetical protein VKQ29_12130 [Aliidongia sp.]|nr:hypothetical protein [Aliidongia sp.]
MVGMEQDQGDDLRDESAVARRVLAVNIGADAAADSDFRVARLDRQVEPVGEQILEQGAKGDARLDLDRLRGVIKTEDAVEGAKFDRGDGMSEAGGSERQSRASGRYGGPLERPVKGTVAIWALDGGLHRSAAVHRDQHLLSFRAVGPPFR